MELVSPLTDLDRLRGQPQLDYRGECRRCAGEHRFVNEPSLALSALGQLFGQVMGDPAFGAIRAALQASRGKMLGVLVAESNDGRRHSLRAYSGEVAGRRDWPDWVGPVLRREDTRRLEDETLARIAIFDRQLAEGEGERVQLRAARRDASRTLSSAMLDAAAVTNARGERRPLREIFVGKGIAGGTTDCTVPKLLEAANVARLRPLALAEAWWGPTINGRHHGDLQPPCDRKCKPVLGHLLCGLEPQ